MSKIWNWFDTCAGVWTNIGVNMAGAMWNLSYGIPWIAVVNLLAIIFAVHVLHMRGWSDV